VYVQVELVVARCSKHRALSISSGSHYTLVIRAMCHLRAAAAAMGPMHVVVRLNKTCVPVKFFISNANPTPDRRQGEGKGTWWGYQPDAVISPSHAHRRPHSPTPTLSASQPPPNVIISGYATWGGRGLDFVHYTTRSLGGLKWGYRSAPVLKGDWVSFRSPPTDSYRVEGMRGSAED
jgi:hypothetical protein